MLSRLLLLAAILVAALPSFARDLHLYEIPNKGPGQIRALQERGLDVVGLDDEGRLLVSAPASEQEFLSQWGREATVRLYAGTANKDLSGSLADYHTYDETQALLQSLASTYPALCELQSMGLSLEGRDIPVLRITTLTPAKAAKPEVLIIGNLHARELMAVEIPLLLAEHLLTNYGSDAEITQLVDTRDIYIAPMMNPDGHVYVENNNAGDWWTWWRKNRKDNGDGSFGVDLNRNFGHTWGHDDLGSSPNTGDWTYRGTAAFSEPETANLEAFVQAHSFSVAFSYHSYGDLLLYPWGYVFDYTVDHELFFTLGQRLTAENGYFPGNPAEGAIYLTNGDSDDWAYGDDLTKYSFLCFTPEVNSYADGGFGPPDTQIQPTFLENLPMNLRLIDLADEPRRVLGPVAPLIQSTIFNAPSLNVQWSGNDPQDPNPVMSYELEEFFAIGHLSQIDADAPSIWWAFDGGFSVSSTISFEGTGSFFSGAGDNLVSSMTTVAPFLVAAPNDVFACRMRYEIEADWDYAYVQVSEDDGLSWVSVPGTGTTSSNPNGTNRGHGISGDTAGAWVDAQFPLTSYRGKTVAVRVVYITDGAVVGAGLWVDVPGPTPVYLTQRIVDPSIPGTDLDVELTAVGHYSYRVRARDAEGDVGRWSNLVTTFVDPITAVSQPGHSISHLAGNYPNPFNPRTLVSFEVGTEHGSAPRFVELEIYSVSGRRVRTLLSGSLQPGSYREPWDGRDDEGGESASGVYFARLLIDGELRGSQKMVLLR
jgi:hypothetical protein